MSKDGLGWRHFTSRFLAVLRRNPDQHPDPGRLCFGFAPKVGTGTSGQKVHVVLSSLARKILDRTTNQNPGIEFGPTPAHGSRNGLSFYGGLERLDQHPGRALQSRANQKQTPLFGKIQLCLTLTTGPLPLSRNLSLSKLKRRRFILNRILRPKPWLLVGIP